MKTWDLWGFRRRQEEAGEGGDPGAGGVGDPPAPKTISLDVLPDELKDLSEAELKFTLSHMSSGLTRKNSENQELRDRLARLEGKVDKPEVTAPDPHAGKTLAELIIEDPEAAIEKVALKRGWIHNMTEVSGKADDALFEVIAAKIPDFEQHEDQVRQILKNSGAPVNRETIMGAYTMAVGTHTLQEKAKSRRKAENSEKPAPAKLDMPKDSPAETALEKEIREAHGMTPEKWAKHKEGSFEIKLPVSR